MIDYSDLPFAKGSRASHWLEGRKRRKAIVDAEDREKTKVRKRDRVCRWPYCENCKAWKPPLEVAHVCGAKGMGGDHGERSTADQMMLLDRITHSEQEAHKRDVVPLTDQGTDGPCGFWVLDGKGEWCLLARERAPFYYEKD